MGLTKTEIYTDKQLRIASIANALSHPARIAILEELITKSTCVCGELVSEIGLSQSTVSQHLKELKEQGLIQGTIEGNKTCYCINYEILDQHKEIIVNFLNSDNKLNIICC